MQCKFCGSENRDGAAFCSACGKRIDGKINCPSCGTANDEKAVYCYACGERLDGKHTCPACGAILPDGAVYCSACGYSTEQPTARAKKPLAFWLELSGGIALLASAAFALIFLFCLGLTSSITSSDLAASGRDEIILYDFFSEYYEEIRLALQNIEQNGEFLAFPLYFNAALGTLIGAGSLLAIPVCIAFAAVRFARFARGAKGNTDYFTPAAAAYAIFLCGACALLALFAGRAEGTEGKVTVALNGATLAGVILGGISFGAGCGLRLAARGRALLTRETIAKGVAAAIGSLFIVIILVFTTQGTIGIKAAERTNANIMSYMAIAGGIFLSRMQPSYTVGTVITQDSSRVPAPFDLLAESLFAVLFQLAVIALAVSLLVLLWKSLMKERKPSDTAGGEPLITVAAFLLACAVGALVASMLFGDAFVEYAAPSATADSTVTLTYTAPIFTLVFSALLLAAVITGVVLSRPIGRKDKPAEYRVPKDDPAP